MIEGMHRDKLQEFNNSKAVSKAILDKINALCDDSTFVQSLSYASSTENDDELKNSMVCGFGKINGQNVGVVAQSLDVNKGSVDVVSINMAAAAVEKATKSGMPIVFLLSSAGMDLKLGVMAMDAYSKLLRSVVRSSGVVPMIGALLGPCVGVHGMLASSLDFVVALEDKVQLGCYSDFVLSANGKYNKEKALAKNGVQFVRKSETEVFDTVKNVLSYLPANNLQRAVDIEPDAMPAGFIGDNYNSVEELIEGVFDGGSILRLYEGKKRFLALGRLNGKSVAIVSNGDEEKGMCSGCCNRFARFVETANCFNLPIITFANSRGMMLDNAQEEKGLLRAASRLAFAYGQAVVPMISVIAGKAVGSGYVILSSKGIGNDFVFAMPDAFISPVDEEAGIRLYYEDKMSGVDNVEAVKEQLKKDYGNEIASPFEAVKQGVIDDILMPNQLREKLTGALSVIVSKRDSMLPKKHGNMPL